MTSKYQLMQAEKANHAIGFMADLLGCPGLATTPGSSAVMSHHRRIGGVTCYEPR